MPGELSSAGQVFLSTERAGRREIRFALLVVLVSAIFFLMAVPFAKVPLGGAPAFVAAYQSALVVCDLVTAALLFSQFNVLRSRAVLVLACGYMFTALIAVVHTLSYPDLFSPDGLLGSGPQSTAWLYFFWHGGFPLFVIAYALLKDKTGESTRASRPQGGSGAAILVSTAVTLAVVSGLTLLATAGHELLPVLMAGPRFSSTMTGIVQGFWMLSVLALIVLLRRRPYTVLDIWLMVVMCAWIFDIGLGAVFNTGRYDFGFYAGRVYALLAASFLLVVLLFENGRYYAQLARMEDKYRGLLEAAPDAIVVIGHDGKIVLLNVQTEKKFGYHRDQLIGRDVKDIIPEGFAERLISDRLRSAQDALAQQIDAGMELVGRRKDGSGFPIEIMLSPLENSEGILVTAAIRDITARKAAETHLQQKIAELNRSNEELGQFAYVASHDLQEPLRMVASYTQLLSRRYKGRLDARADEFLAFAEDGAIRMQQLIQDLLEYSRVGSKGKDLHATSGEDALWRALANLRGAIETSGALVTHDPLPVVLADAMQLTQLFQNLVGNAIKYQNSGTPTVHISVSRNDRKKWSFAVKDNGLGIDPENFARIFGMFQRLHKREEFAGTGIGLAICKKIVERHGDNISVESQLGRGSTFRFALASDPAA
jgi:PAS domain S-box-containing protein